MSIDKAKAKAAIERIDEFVSTARRVKGDHFATFVLFMVDMAQLIHVTRILSNFCEENGAEDRVEAVQFLTQAIMSQTTVRMADVFNLSEEDCKEAINLCDQIMSSLKSRDT